MDRFTKGVTANVKVDRLVREIIEGIIAEGIPHHYSIVWQDVAEAMNGICGLLNIPVIEM